MYHGMGDISLSNIWEAGAKGAEQAFQQILPAAQAEIAKEVLKDPNVQKQIQTSASQSLAQNIMKNKWVYIGGLAVALMIFYSLGRKKA